MSIIDRYNSTADVMVNRMLALPAVLRSSIQLKHRTVLIEHVRCSNAYVVVDVSKSGTLTSVQDAAAIKPAGWLATTLLFGVPALVFAFLFHQLGPDLWHHGTSWWRIFQLLLILPLVLMLVAALVGAALDLGSVSWKTLWQRLRLSAPRGTAWLWAVALSGFMFGGNWADCVAVAASWLALWKEKTSRRWAFVGTLAAVLVKRNAGLLQTRLQSVRFFDPSVFHREFFSHFGPQDFMGVPLQGAWWILVYYAVVMLVCNIGGADMCCHDRNWHLARLHGLSMASFGQPSTYSCSRLSGIQSGC